MTRQAADRLLRWVRISSFAGLAVIVVLAIVLSDQRGLLLAIGAVYLITSLAAYLVLRRSLAREFARLERQRAEQG